MNDFTHPLDAVHGPDRDGHRRRAERAAALSRDPKVLARAMEWAPYSGTVVDHLSNKLHLLDHQQTMDLLYSAHDAFNTDHQDGRRLDSHIRRIVSGTPHESVREEAGSDLGLQSMVDHAISSSRKDTDEYDDGYDDHGVDRWGFNRDGKHHSNPNIGRQFDHWGDS